MKRNDPFIRRWSAETTSKSQLSDEDKKKATSVAAKAIREGGLRGDVSDALRGAGFTNEQFNFELMV